MRGRNQCLSKRAGAHRAPEQHFAHCFSLDHDTPTRITFLSEKRMIIFCSRANPVDNSALWKELGASTASTARGHKMNRYLKGQHLPPVSWQSDRSCKAYCLIIFTQGQSNRQWRKMALLPKKCLEGEMQQVATLQGLLQNASIARPQFHACPSPHRLTRRI